MADAHGAICARAALQFSHHSGNCFDGFLVGSLRRRHAQPRALDATRVERQPLDFGAAEVDANAHALSWAPPAGT